MNSNEAKKILALYRPASADARDAYFTEALALAASDEGLRGRFKEHCAVYVATRNKFKQISIPAGLKEQILTEIGYRLPAIGYPKANPPVFWQRRPVLLAAAAIIILFFSIVPLLLRPKHDENNLSAYQNRMVSTALRAYDMVEMDDLEKIRAYLMEKNAPMDALPAGIQKAQSTGCVILSWQGKPVSMICFRTGQPLPPGEKSDLFLFITDRASVPDAPASSAPVFAQINKLMTATWTQNGKTYVLAATGDERLLRKYF